MSDTETQEIHASCWRLGALGVMISSSPEWYAASVAADEEDVIYFFAEFEKASGAPE